MYVHTHAYITQTYTHIHTHTHNWMAMAPVAHFGGSLPVCPSPMTVIWQPCCPKFPWIFSPPPFCCWLPMAQLGPHSGMPQSRLRDVFVCQFVFRMSPGVDSEASRFCDRRQKLPNAPPKWPSISANESCSFNCEWLCAIGRAPFLSPASAIFGFSPRRTSWKRPWCL